MMEDCLQPNFSEIELLDCLEVIFENNNATIEECLERYLLNAVDRAAWHGLWRPSRYTRRDLAIKESTSVFKVQVVEVDFLDAIVRHHECQPDETLRVPLHELFILFHQPEEVIVDDVKTACGLEVIRSLFEYIWQPWDTDSDFRKEIRNRVEVYFSMKNGSIETVNSIKMKAIVEDAWHINKCLKGLPEDEDKVTPAEVVRMARLNLRSENLRNELEYLENPLIRHYLPPNLNESFEHIREFDEHQVLLVGSGLELSSLADFLECVKDELPSSSSCSLMPDLCTALTRAAPRNTICLCEGTHRFTLLRGLASGGQIMGMSSPEKTMLNCEDAGDVIMSVTSGTLTLKNLSIKGCLRHYVILVHPNAAVTVDNCVISDAVIGVMVFPGGRANITNSAVSVVDVGLEVRSDASATLNNTMVKQCDVGLQVEEGAKVEMACGEPWKALVASWNITQNDGNQIECRKGDISELEKLGENSPIVLKNVSRLSETDSSSNSDTYL